MSELSGHTDQTQNGTSNTKAEPFRKKRDGWNAVLSDEGLMRAIFEYVGPHQFRFVALVNRSWNNFYREVHNDTATLRKYAISGGNKRALEILCREAYDERSERSRSWMTVQITSPGTMLSEMGNLRTLQWLTARHRRFAIMESTPDVLEDPNGPPWSISVIWGTCDIAARCGHLKVLKWLVANGWSWGIGTCRAAAEGGQIAVLVWAKDNGYEWTDDAMEAGVICEYAASEGQLGVLKWARSIGCEWHSDLYALAARGGHLETLQWARANGCGWECEWEAEECLGEAQYYRRSETAAWIIAQMNLP